MMSLNDANLIRAHARAVRLTDTYGLRFLKEFTLEDLAGAHNIQIVCGGLAGAEGRLLRHGKRGILRIGNAAVEPTRRRFIIAHELGHWFLHENKSQWALTCSEADIHDYRRSPMEVEANCFATELLMPRQAIPASMLKGEPGIQGARLIAQDFSVSLTAAMLRYDEICNHACMAVVSENTEVLYWRANKRLSWAYLPSRQPLSREAIAWSCFNERNRETNPALEEVPFHAWFPDHRQHDAGLWEASMTLGSTGRVLTLLWLPDSD